MNLTITKTTVALFLAAVATANLASAKDPGLVHDGDTVVSANEASSGPGGIRKRRRDNLVDQSILILDYNNGMAMASPTDGESDIDVLDNLFADCGKDESPCLLGNNLLDIEKSPVTPSPTKSPLMASPTKSPVMASPTKSPVMATCATMKVWGNLAPIPMKVPSDKILKCLAAMGGYPFTFTLNDDGVEIILPSVSQREGHPLDSVGYPDFVDGVVTDGLGFVGTDHTGFVDTGFVDTDGLGAALWMCLCTTCY